MGKKMIIVPRGTHPDGPYRAAVAGDRIVVPRMGFTPFTVAGQPTGDAGGVGYCSDGDAGARVGCAHDGSIWRKLAVGAEVALGVEWLFAGGSDDFHRVLGPAAAATNPLNARQPPGTAGGATKFHSMYSPDGQVIWLGGQAWGVAADANTLWYSDDGGSTWSNRSLEHADAQYGNAYSMWGLSANSIFCCGLNSLTGGNTVAYWNGVTWSSAAPLGTTTAVGYPFNCVWGTSTSDMYLIVQIAAGTADILYRNQGAGWVAEGSGANSLRAAIATLGTNSVPCSVVGDGLGNLWVTADRSGGDSIEVWKGTFGGGWTNELNVAGYVCSSSPGAGRNIAIDETGAVWAYAFQTGGTNDWSIWRRDPDTGIFALNNTFDGSAGTFTVNVLIVDSANICVTGDRFIGLYDGSSWYTYDTGLTGWNWANAAPFAAYGRYL